MPFRCPQCKAVDSLDIEAMIELPPDRRSSEISLQVVYCPCCQFRGLAVYEELRHAGRKSEGWEHIGYWVSPDAVNGILEAIHSCPDPYNPACECEAHVGLGEKDMRGIWSGLLEMERGHIFAMRLYAG